MNEEKKRLQDPAWKKWGPYLSERQWGTVREDYSAEWNSLGIHLPMKWPEVRPGAGEKTAWADWAMIKLQLCLAVSLWNEKDPILKERYFGLTGNQGNHGEDVKELYYFLDATPTHSYLKMLYKYPQAANSLMRNCWRKTADEGKKIPNMKSRIPVFLMKTNISMFLLNMQKLQQKIF